jgi:exonuclease III
MINDEEENDADDDIPNWFKHSPYYNTDSFVNLLSSKQSSFKIISLNCQSLNAKIDQICTFIENLRQSSCNIDAFCLQETWLNDDSLTFNLQIEGFNLITRNSSCSAHGGVAIYLNDQYSYKSIPVSSRNNIWDGMFIEVENFSNTAKNVIIGNIYRPPRNNVINYREFFDEMNEIFSSYQRLRKEVIIVGDFNLDLLKLNDNQHIRDYFELIMSCGFLPRITFPTRLTQQGGTLIDNILVKLSDHCAETAAGILMNNISDHQPCFLIVDNLINRFEICKTVKVYKNDPDSIIRFKNEISYQCALDRFSSNDPNVNYDILDSSISNALEKHLPTKIVRFKKHKHRKMQWITHGIIRSIKYRDKLYSKMRTARTDEHYHLYKTNLQTYNRILKQSIRNAKKLYYQNCFNNFKDDIKKTWKTINDMIGNIKTKSDFPQYFLVNNEIVNNPKDIANEFNDYFVKIGTELASKIESPQNSSFNDYLTTPVRSQFKFKQTNTNEVIKIIDKLKPKRSHGIDGSSNIILKEIKHELAPCLTKIINQSIESGIFPYRLKIAKVIPIFKNNETNLLCNYRPISVLPSTSKIFERILHTQLQNYFTESKLFYKSQYGFRPNHSTELAALELIDQIIIKMDKNEVPLNIYLDLSKAFDTLDHEILLTKLYYYGIRGQSFELMKNYLADRKQYVEFKDNNSEFSDVTTGVPQGSILGPLLFLIYINDINHASSCFCPVIYADDTTLSTTLNYFSENISDSNIDRKLNTEIEKITKWLKLNKLSLNVQKTKAMIFHTSRRKIRNPKLKIESNDILFVTEFNFLGIHLDSNLRWQTHINKISNKISRANGIFNRMKHILPENILLTLYNTLVLPHFNYGVLLWGGHLNRLERLQKKTIRAVTNSKYNGHTEPLFKRLKVLKVTHIRALHELKFCFKLHHHLLPEYFLHNIFIRHSEVHSYRTRHSRNYQLPQVRHSFAKNSIRFIIPQSFNNAPQDIIRKIDTHSFVGFKCYVKYFFLNTYQTSCNIRNCFVCQN